MSDVNTLKEFLVSLGFKVDASSERAFTVSVDNVEKAVNDLGDAAKQAATDTETSANKSVQANSKAAQESKKSANSQTKDKQDIARAENQAEEARKKAEKARQDANKRRREDLEKSHKDQLAKNKAQIEGLLSYAKTMQYVALAVGVGIVKMATDLNNLYFASLRTNSSVDKIQGLNFVSSQTNGDFAGSLEGLSSFIRRSPGAYDLINKIGVATKGANGQLRDTSDILLDVGKSLANMPIAQAIAFSNALGIDENTLLAMRRGDLQQYIDLQAKYAKTVGLNGDDAAKNASAFKGQIASVTTILDLIGKKIAGNIANDQKGGLNKLIDYLLTHSDQIVTGVTNFANAMASLAISIAKVVSFLADVIAFFAPLASGVSSITGLTGEWQGALNLLLAYVAGKWLLGMLGSIGKVSAAVGLATAQSSGLMALLGKAGMVGGAGAAGYGIGSLIYNHLIDGTKFGESIGKGVANVLGFLGISEARQATQSSPTPTAIPAPARKNGTPRGIRNNNPGNIEYGEFAKRMGATGTDGRFAIFPSPEGGLAALSALLSSYGSRGINTVQAVINRYAPPNENNTAGYSAGVARAMGVSPMQPLNMGDPMVRAALMQQITRIENGSNPYASDMMINASRTTSSKSLQFSQQTNINVNSSNSALAQDVANASSRATEAAIRNFIPKVQ